MPQSLVQDYLHIVYSTKMRVPYLKDKEVREEMFRYLSGVCRNIDCPPICVGGHIDHVHIFCRLSANVTIANLIKSTKVDSSKWIKTKGQDYRGFRWQSGYGAFSISASHRKPLISYIQGQEEHHRTVTFQEEFLTLLKKYGVEYDEQYLWD